MAAIRAPFDREAFTVAFTLAARRVGRAPLPAGWSADEAARAALLVQAATAQPPGPFAALVDDLYQHGDSRERQAVLRALACSPPRSASSSSRSRRAAPTCSRCSRRSPARTRIRPRTSPS